MIALPAVLSYLNVNFAIKYLLLYTSKIIFMFFFIFILIKFSILTPVDTLNLAVGCSPSYDIKGMNKCLEAFDRLVGIKIQDTVVSFGIDCSVLSLKTEEPNLLESRPSLEDRVNFSNLRISG